MEQIHGLSTAWMARKGHWKASTNSHGLRAGIFEWISLDKGMKNIQFDIIGILNFFERTTLL